MPFVNENRTIALDYNFVNDPKTKIEPFPATSAGSVIRLALKRDHTRIYVTYNPAEIE